MRALQHVTIERAARTRMLQRQGGYLNAHENSDAFPAIIPDPKQHANSLSCKTALEGASGVVGSQGLM